MGWSIYKTPALAPLAFIMSAGMVMVVLFAGRSLFKNIDASWKKEQTPQNAMENKQFKLFNLRNIDYENNIQVPKY